MPINGSHDAGSDGEPACRRDREGAPRSTTRSEGWEINYPRSSRANRVTGGYVEIPLLTVLPRPFRARPIRRGHGQVWRRPEGQSRRSHLERDIEGKLPTRDNGD